MKNERRAASLRERRVEAARDLTKVISALNGQAEADALLVVEGPKDELALKRLGVRGEWFKLSQAGFGGLLTAAEKRSRVILLLDYDRKGRYMFARALRMLQSKGISSDSHFRTQIRSATKGEVKHIEDMEMYLGLA